MASTHWPQRCMGVLWLGTNIKVVDSSNAASLPVRPCAIRPPRTRTHEVIPIADRLEKVNMDTITMPVPAQDGITGGNVIVVWMLSSTPGRASGACGCRRAGRHVGDPPVRHTHYCVSIIGKATGRPAVQPRGSQSGAGVAIDSPALGWGVRSTARNQGCSASRFDEAVDWTPSRGGA